MNPFAGLGLTHAEEERLNDLKRVDFEIEQDEQQAVSIREQQRFPIATRLTLAGMLTLLFGLMLDVSRGLMKRRQQIEKRLG
jgi:hypothetical protein